MNKGESILLIVSVGIIISTLDESICCAGSSHQIKSEQRRITKIPETNSRVERAEEENQNDTEYSGKRRPNLAIKYKQYSLPKGYDKLQIPSLGYGIAFSQGTTFTSVEVDVFDMFGSHLIDVTLRIKNIDGVDEIEEEITFAVDFILTWTDNVLARHALVRFNVNSEEFLPNLTDTFYRTLDSEFLQQIWKPDIYFEDLIKIDHPKVISEPVTLRVNEATGQIIYASRMRVRMKCEMDFHYYPADTQTCEVVLRSASYTTRELLLRWKEPQGAFLEDCGGTNYDFQITNVINDVLNEGFIGDEKRQYNIVRLKILARRKLSYHMVQTFLPSTFFIIITWLCFLVPTTMIEARIGIAMTTLLTLTAMFASVRESSPIVSYVRVIDIWMIACIFFVFLTLLEFTVLLWLRRTATNEPEKILGEKVEEEVEFKPCSNDKLGRQDHQHEMNKKHLKEHTAKFIETFAFWIFSLIFVVFTVAFWSLLLIHSGYFDWSVDKKFNCVNTCKYASDGCGGKVYGTLSYFDFDD